MSSEVVRPKGIDDVTWLRNSGQGQATLEQPQVKCKDCGAFGHTARNLRKEEQQRKLLQRFPRRPCGRQPQSWKQELEPGLCLRHPNLPVLIHTSKRKSLQHPDHPRGSPTRRDDVKSSLSTVPLIGRNLAPASKGCIEAPGKRCAQTPTLTCVNPPKKPRLSPVQIPQQSTLTANPGAFLNHPPPPSTAGRGRRVAVRVSRETPAQGQRFDLKLPADRSPSRSVRAFSAAHPSPIIVIPAQPLRMLFLRDGEGCWSCGYTVPPSPWPVERRSVDQEPEVHAIPRPRSILYDDLQVSSSSEESNWDEDTSGD
ncbi:hypothetical protein E5288_WYG003700 [Bos mutus]|uniref:Zinc knuckle domain-containing protein n=1 Tax=Bos mutus TaxID=72004 RepID=A0A6B0SCC1_9CETA|nr:hypothetical protein [Bos mutus]